MAAASLFATAGQAPVALVEFDVPAPDYMMRFFAGHIEEVVGPGRIEVHDAAMDAGGRLEPEDITLGLTMLGERFTGAEDRFGAPDLFAERGALTLLRFTVSETFADPPDAIDHPWIKEYGIHGVPRPAPGRRFRIEAGMKLHGPYGFDPPPAQPAAVPLPAGLPLALGALAALAALRRHRG